MGLFCRARVYPSTLSELDVETDDDTHILRGCEQAYDSYNEAF